MSGAAPFDLVAAVARRVAAEGEQPAFVFRRAGWRWRSWRWWQERAHAVAAALPHAGRGAVAWRFVSSPEDYAVDLGIQLAGGEAQPLSAGEGLAGSLWLDLAGREPEGGSAAQPCDVEALAVATAEPPGGGCGGVLRGGERRALAAEELGEAIARLPAPAAAREGVVTRPILLTAFGLDTLAGRAVAGWAVEARAALVLEPEVERLAQVLFWTRPTIIALPGGQLRDVERALDRWADRPVLRRRLARRLGRLGQLWTDDDGSEGPAPLWVELGTRIFSLPIGEASTPR